MHFQIANKHAIKNSAPTIVGTGLVALDILLKENCSTADTALGGSVGNVLAILGHLGWHSTPVAKLGMDAAADRIFSEFESLGADTRFLRKFASTSTPVVFQLPGVGGKSHDFSFCCPVCGRKRAFSAPTKDDESSMLFDSIQRPDVFFFDRVTPWALELAQRYRNAGTLIVFEPSTVGKDFRAFSEAIELAHILKYADDRIADLRGISLASVNLEIQTLGKDGLKFRLKDDPSNWQWLNAFDVPFIQDTAGSGDWCTSGFLYAMIGNIYENGGRGFLSTRRVRESLRFGQILAALNCMEVGARGLAKRHESAQIVEQAASIRNSAGSRIASPIGKRGSKQVSCREAPLAPFSPLLCCEAFTN